MKAPKADIMRAWRIYDASNRAAVEIVEHEPVKYAALVEWSKIWRRNHAA